MAELRNIVKRPVVSDYSRVTPQGGTALAGLADMANTAYEVLAPAAVQETEMRATEAWREQARRDMGAPPSFPSAQTGPQGQPLSGVGAVPDWQFSMEGAPGTQLMGLIDRTEGGGRYDTLFGHSQREGGRFAGADVTNMTLGELRNFTDVNGEYGQWVSGQVGRVATPMGRFQIVGTTLRNAASELGLSDDTVFNAQTQEQIFRHLANRRLSSARTMDGKIAAMRAEWEGFNHVPDAQLAAAITEYEAVGQLPPDNRETVLEHVGNQIVPPTTDGAMSSPSFGSDYPLAPGSRENILGNMEHGARDAGGSEVLRNMYDGGRVSSQGAPTTLRTREGRVEPRLYSPLSHPILQAHNAAAGVAYISETTLRGQEQFAAMAMQYEGDPAGFRQAATSYVDQLVQDAPREFQADLYNQFSAETTRTYLGLVEDAQREQRQRADNSSRALLTRYQSDLAEAIASGSPDEIGAARQNLEGVLYARESLPGVAWTREQSENSILDAFDQADRLRSSAATAQSNSQRDALQLIIAAAGDGRSAADESILMDPSVRAAHPELAREAAAMVALRDNMPGYLQMPPAEQAAMIAEERSRPLGAEWEADILDAMESAHQASVKALDEDPIAWAQRSRPTTPPPELPDPTSEDFVVGLQARRAYADQMVTDGYVEAPLYFTQGERDAMSALVAEGSDPLIAAATATALFQGFGSAAGRVMTELDASPILQHTAGIASIGGNMDMVAAALTGQQMIDEGIVVVPTRPTAVGAVSDDLDAALPMVPGLRGNLQKTALALYATRARGVDPASDAAVDLMEEAYQQALGQQTIPRSRTQNVTTGGVQDVQGHPTLLPPTVSPSMVEAGLRAALGQDAVIRRNGAEDRPATPGDVARWGGSVPSFNGQPLTSATMQNAKFIPLTDARGNVIANRYRIEVMIGNSAVDVADQNGNVFTFNMGTLTEGMR